MAYQSKWGWHPCDYETFLLLRKLYHRYWQALRRFAEWQRWERKQPHNRVVRARIVDEKGRKIGSRVIGPRPEPPLDPLFCTQQTVVQHRQKDGKGVRIVSQTVRFHDRGIPEAFRAARLPAADEAAVPRLKLSVEDIHRLEVEGG